MMSLESEYVPQKPVFVTEKALVMCYIDILQYGTCREVYDLGECDIIIGYITTSAYDLPGYGTIPSLLLAILYQEWMGNHKSCNKINWYDVISIYISSK